MADLPRLLVGAGLLVLGILLVVGRLGLDPIIPYLGIVLIVFGILMLLHVVPGSLLTGILLLVLGILLQGNWLNLPDNLDQILGVANLVVGILLIVLGALKLLGR